MDKNEKGIFIASIIITILFSELFIFGGIGITVPIYLFVYYLMLFVYCKKSNISIGLKNSILFIPIILCAICFVLYDNDLLKCLNVLFLWFLAIMNTADILQLSGEKEWSFKTPINVFTIAVIYPLNYISECIDAIKNEFSGKCKGKLGTLRKVIIGLTFGGILLAIVIPLLMHSDAAFSGMMRLIGDNLNFEFISKVLKRIITFIILFFPMYSFAYGITHKDNISESNIAEAFKGQIKLDFTIIITLMTLVVSIYLLFCVSQFSYFTSAFEGILPKDFSYSQYARKGFFEAIPLSLINFMLIILLNKLLYQNESSYKRIVMRVYSFFICGISLFIVITAISKLVLYMRVYGLTILRIYSAWFLIVLSLILVSIYIYSFYNKMNLFKTIFIIFTTMYLALNYMNVDYVIGKYNVMLDNKDKTDTIETFENLSLSAAEPLCEIDLYYNDTNDDDVVGYYIHMKENYKKKIVKRREWYYWNYAKYKAEKAFIESEGEDTFKYTLSNLF